MKRQGRTTMKVMNQKEYSTYRMSKAQPAKPSKPSPCHFNTRLLTTNAANILITRKIAIEVRYRFAVLPNPRLPSRGG